MKINHIDWTKPIQQSIQRPQRPFCIIGIFFSPSAIKIKLTQTQEQKKKNRGTSSSRRGGQFHSYNTHTQARACHPPCHAMPCHAPKGVKLESPLSILSPKYRCWRLRNFWSKIQNHFKLGTWNHNATAPFIIFSITLSFIRSHSHSTPTPTPTVEFRIQNFLYFHTPYGLHLFNALPFPLKIKQTSLFPFSFPSHWESAKPLNEWLLPTNMIHK